PPPSSPPPWSPSSPLPPTNCTTIVSFSVEISKKTEDVQPYSFTENYCIHLQAELDKIFATYEELAAINDHWQGAAVSPYAQCTATRYIYARELFYDHDNITLNRDILNAAETATRILLDLVTNGAYGCRSWLQGYIVNATSTSSDVFCLNSTVSHSIPCNVPDYMNCTCNTKKGILPFTSFTSYAAPQPRLKPSNTTEYCFSIGILPQDKIQESNCSGIDTLLKVGWNADYKLRQAVKAINLYPKGAEAKSIQPTWGGPTVFGPDSLRATNINWSVAQANGSRICVEVQNPKTFWDLCYGGGPGNCLISFYNVKNDCCPVYVTGPPP
ncbi:hypothetical protein Vafri_12022, partial [Volvox africanus]